MWRFLAIICALLPLPALAEQVLVAVASNFVRPAEALVRVFEAESGHKIELASGSTGQHFAQIVHGAPYDVFLAADQLRPARLVEMGLASNAFTYAYGRLALISHSFDLMGSEQEYVSEIKFIAIANPETAPYGRAAEQVLQLPELDLLSGATVVQGQNVGQAFAFVASGTADLGLVALSQAQDADFEYFILEPDWHDPIRQDAVLLAHGADNLAAREFLAYLASDAAQEMIVSFGYDAPVGRE